MSTMTTTDVPAGEWTVIYTAAGTVTIAVQNQTPSSTLKIRVDASASTGDATTAPHDVLQPFQIVSYALASGDVVMACPTQATPGRVNVKA